MGVSGYQSTTYDPAVENSGNAASYTGPYKLRIERLDGNATSLSGLNGVILSGTAARNGAAAANVGQTLTVSGTGLLKVLTASFS